MKVLGKTTDYRGDLDGVVVQLTDSEFAMITTANRYNKLRMSEIRDGSDVDICDRFTALLALETKACDAARVGEALRAMAAAVDAVVKNASEAILPPKSDSADIS